MNRGKKPVLKGMLLYWLVFLFFGIPGAAAAFWEWRSIKTEKFTVYYKKEYENRAIELLSRLEFYAGTAEKICGNTAGNIPVVLESAGRQSNGLADPLSRKISVFNYEPRAMDWLSYVGIHEYTHILQMSKAGGLPGLLTVFSPLASPNFSAVPYWIVEGFAVYAESRISPFEGRLNDGSFTEIINAYAREGREISLMDATYSPAGVPGGRGIYIFGGSFIQYLSEKFGEDKNKLFLEKHGSSVLSYLTPLIPAPGIDLTFNEVYGHPPENLWKQWQKDYADKVKSAETKGTALTRDGWYKSGLFFSRGCLYYIKRHTEKTGPFETRGYSEIVKLDADSGEKKTVHRSSGGYSLPPKARDNRIFFGESEIRGGYANKYFLGYGFYTVLSEKNTETGRERKIYEGHLRAFGFYGGDRLILAEDKGPEKGSRVFIADGSGKEIRELYDGEYLIFDIFSKDEYIVVSAKKDGENPSLFLLDEDKGSLVPVVDSLWREENPAVYGERIFFNGNYEGIRKVYAYDIKEKQLYSAAGTDAALMPVFNEKTDEIIYADVNTKGNDIYKTAFDPEFYEIPEAPEKTAPVKNLDEDDFKRGGYTDNIPSLFPHSRIPAGYYDAAGRALAGLAFMGKDVLEDFFYTGYFMYDINRKRTAGMISGYAYVFQPAAINLEYSNYDIAGNRYDETASVTMSVPFFKSYMKGLSGLSGIVGYEAYDSLKKNRLRAGLNAQIRYPFFDAAAAYTYYSGNGISFDSGSHITELKASFYIENGTLEFSGKNIYSREYIYRMNLRSGTAVESKNMNYASAELKHLLFNVRSGLWNPNIYFEDVIGSVFAQSVLSEEGLRACAGAALHIETKMFFGAMIDWGIRAGITENAGVFVNLFAGTPML
ncbi:MAG: hypothetical protein ACLFP1_08035 [Candidatus Goldiibacteriota bacterium]